MADKKRVIIVILAVIVCLYFLASISVHIFGKRIAESQISSNLKMPAKIGSLGVGFPFSITLTNLELGNLARVEKISFSPNLLGFITGRIVLGNLTVVNPLLTIEQAANGKTNLPELEQKGKQPPLFITGLAVNNGKIVFTDRRVDRNGYTTIIEKLNVKVSKVMLPLASLRTNFRIEASLTDNKDKMLGDIFSSGWLDFGPKNMDGTFQIKGLEVAHFSPYYGNFISDRELTSGKLNIDSDLKAENNALKILSKLKLSDLIYAEPEPKEEDVQQQVISFDIAKNALDFFKDESGNVNLDFSIETKLDKPNFSPAALRRIILRAAAKNIAAQSPDKVIEKVGNVLEQFKSLGKDLESLFKKKE